MIVNHFYQKSEEYMSNTNFYRPLTFPDQLDIPFIKFAWYTGFVALMIENIETNINVINEKQINIKLVQQIIVNLEEFKKSSFTVQKNLMYKNDNITNYEEYYVQTQHNMWIGFILIPTTNKFKDNAFICNFKLVIKKLTEDEILKIQIDHSAHH